MSSARDLPMVNFPFFNCGTAFDGWRPAFVIDAGGDGRKAKLFLWTKLQVVEVPAADLARKGKPMAYTAAGRREYIANLVRIYRDGGISYERAATVFVLQCLKAQQKVIRLAAAKPVKVDPASIKSDSQLLTAEQARQIDREQTRFFRACGLTLQSDLAHVQTMASVKVDANGAEQFQMPIRGKVEHKKAKKPATAKRPATATAQLEQTGFGF